MKNPAGKSSKKTKVSVMSVNTTLLNHRTMKNLIEKLADERYETGYIHEKVQSGWHAIETSSLEADVSGDLYLSDKTGLVRMLFFTCFLFTCTKGTGEECNLTWGFSLS